MGNIFKKVTYISILSLFFSLNVYAGECQDSSGGIFGGGFTCTTNEECTNFTSGAFNICVEDNNNSGGGDSNTGGTPSTPTAQDITFSINSNEQYTFKLTDFVFSDSSTITGITYSNTLGENDGTVYHDDDNDNEVDSSEDTISQFTNLLTYVTNGKLKYKPGTSTSVNFAMYISSNLNPPTLLSVIPTVTIVSSNKAPTANITKTDNYYTFSVNENETIVNSLNSIATDEDGDTLSYSIVTNTNDNSSSFFIDSNNNLVLNNALDYETLESKDLYLTIAVTDSQPDNQTDLTFDFKVSVNDVQEAPTASITKTDNYYTFSVNENETIVNSLNSIATDEDGDTLSYSIVTNTNDNSSSFFIDSNNNLALNSALDYEALESKDLYLTIAVTDSQPDNQADLTFDFKVSVKNVNELEIDRFIKDASISINSQILFDTTLDKEGDKLTYSNFTIGNEDLATLSYKEGVWEQIGDTLIGSKEGELFGQDIALSNDGSTIAIVKNKQDENPFSGIVEVYKNNNNTWEKIADDIIAYAYDVKVSLNNDGTILAIASTHYDNEKGKVEIYTNSSNTWIKSAEILGTTINENLGSQISLNDDGTVIAISSSGSSFVSIYKNINSTWTKQGENIEEITASSISINTNGDILIIGDTSYNENQGQTKVYKFEDSSWTQIGSTIIGDYKGSKSGVVSINSIGDIIAIGSTGNENVKIFKYSQEEWSQIGSNITNTDYEDFASSLSLNANGNTITISAPKHQLYDNKPGITITYKNIDNDWVETSSYIYGEILDTYSKSSTINRLNSAGTVLAISEMGYKNNIGYTKIYSLNTNKNILFVSLNDEQIGTSSISYKVSDGSLTNDKSFTLNVLEKSTISLDTTNLIKKEDNSLEVNVDENSSYITTFKGKTVVNDFVTYTNLNSDSKTLLNQDTSFVYYLDENEDNISINLDTVTGEASFYINSLPDYETTKSYEINLKVIDQNENTLITPIKININDVQETPKILATKTDGYYEFKIEENQTYITKLSSLVNDEDGDTLSYTIVTNSNDDSSLFKIDENNNLNLIEAKDYETLTNKELYLDINVSDSKPDNSVDVKLEVKVVIEDVNDLNLPNMIEDINIIDVTRDTQIELNIEDKDGDNLTYKNFVIKDKSLFDINTIEANKWIQVNEDIEQSDSIGFGKIVLLNDDASLMVIASDLAIYTYKNENSKWTQINKLTPEDARDYFFKNNLTLNKAGNVLAVNYYSTTSEVTRVYNLVDNNWVEANENIFRNIINSTIKINDEGTLLAGISIYYYDDQTEKVYTLIKIVQNNSSQWEIRDTIKVNIENNNYNEHGLDLNSTGDIVAINNGTFIYIFKYENSTWSEIGKIENEYYSQLGKDIKLNDSGDIISINLNGNTIKSYKNDGTNTWTEITNIIDEYNEELDELLAINSDTTIMANTTKNNSSVYFANVYKNIDDSWKRIGDSIEGIEKLKIDDIALDYDGNNIALGITEYKQSGLVRVYNYNDKAKLVIKLKEGITSGNTTVTYDVTDGISTQTKTFNVNITNIAAQTSDVKQIEVSGNNIVLTNNDNTQNTRTFTASNEVQTQTTKTDTSINRVSTLGEYSLTETIFNNGTSISKLNSASRQTIFENSLSSPIQTTFNNSGTTILIPMNSQFTHIFRMFTSNNEISDTQLDIDETNRFNVNGNDSLKIQLDEKNVEIEDFKKIDFTGLD